MNLLTLLYDLDDHVDLLTKTDEWLEQQRISLSSELNGLVDDLEVIQRVQRIKTRLNQNNLVAIENDREDGTKIVSIMSRDKTQKVQNIIGI